MGRGSKILVFGGSFFLLFRKNGLKIKSVQQVWADLTDEEIRPFFLNMPDRIEAVIANGGGRTKY